MNCGCSVTDNVITMCPMHEAGPKLWKLWKAAEQLVEANERAHQEVAKGNEYTLPDDVAIAIGKIEDIILCEEEDRLKDGVVEKVLGEEQTHQPKLN